MPQNPIWRPQATGNPQIDEIFRQMNQQINDLQNKTKSISTSSSSGSTLVSVSNQPITSFALTAAVKTNVGNPITIKASGTYLLIYTLEAASGTSTNVHGYLFKNGQQLGVNFNMSTAGTIGSNQGFFLFSAIAGDTLQTIAQADAAGTFNLIVQTILIKQ